MEILTEQLASTDEDRRREAVIGLRSISRDAAIDHILLAIGDASWRVRKEAVDALLAGEVGDDIVERLIGMLGASENAGLRNSAVEALEKLGSRALPSLCRSAATDDADVRKFVLDILGNIGDRQAVPFLVAALADTDANVSAAAAENLGKLGDESALPALLDAVRKDDLWLRHTILEALARIGRPVKLDALDSLRSDKFLRKALFDCLGAIGSEDAVPLLLEGLSEKTKNLREAAVAGLMKIHERLTTAEAEGIIDEQLRSFQGKPEVELLLPSMESQDRSLQQSLMRLLGIIGDGRAVPALLSQCRDERLRHESLAALKRLGPAAAEALLKLYPAMDEDDRCFILYLCGELKIAGSTSVVKEAFGSAKSLLRKTAALAAGKLGDTGLLDELAELLDDARPEVRDAAISSIARLAEKNRGKALAIASVLCGARSHEKRGSAASLLAALGEADKLALLLKDEEAAVRKAAVNAMAELGEKVEVSHLVMALADEDSDVRIAVANALGEIGSVEVVDPLILALQDEDMWVRCAALRSIGRVGGRRIEPAVLRLAENAGGIELISALQCIAETGGDEATGFLLDCLRNDDEEVVKAALGHLSDRGEWIDSCTDLLLGHPHWDVRHTFLQILAEAKGRDAVPILREWVDSEDDDLVREAALSLLDRLT